jgi:hypothetical protein
MAEVPAILGQDGLANSASKTGLTRIDEGFTFPGFRVAQGSARAGGRRVGSGMKTGRPAPV